MFKHQSRLFASQVNAAHVLNAGDGQHVPVRLDEERNEFSCALYLDLVRFSVKVRALRDTTEQPRRI
jgi:hypothetical protein